MVSKETQLPVAPFAMSPSRKLEGKLKRKLLQKKDRKKDGTEILESWLREILAASLVGEILDLTFEHSPFESSDDDGILRR